MEREKKPTKNELRKEVKGEHTQGGGRGRKLSVFSWTYLDVTPPDVLLRRPAGVEAAAGREYTHAGVTYSRMHEEEEACCVSLCRFMCMCIS